MKNMILLTLLFSLNLIISASDSYPAKGVYDIEGLSDEEIEVLIKKSNKKLIAIQVSAFKKNWSCGSNSEQFAQILKKKSRDLLAIQINGNKMKLVIVGEEISWSHSSKLINSYIEPFRKMKVDMNGKPFVLISSIDKKTIAAFTNGRKEFNGATQKLNKSLTLVKSFEFYKKELAQAEKLAGKLDFNSALNKIKYAINKSKKEISKISESRNELLNIPDSTELIHNENDYKKWTARIVELFNGKLDKASELIDKGAKKEAALLLKNLYKAPKAHFSRFGEIKDLYKKCKN